MLSTELKSQIQGAYTRFLEAKGLKARYGQRLMIAEVAKVLGTVKVDDEGRRSSEPAVVAVEAGTGTGKTVAYSLAAIPTAKAAGKRLVIATATVALQEQIVHKDLPDLMRNSGLSFSFALAKGRGRYLCLSKLDMLLQQGQAQSATAQLFEEEGFRIDVDEQGQKLFTAMIEKLAGNKWDGDRDSWPEELEDSRWAQLTTDLNGFVVDDEDLNGYLMYPKVFLDYMGRHKAYGPVRALPTRSFFYGMQPGEEITAEIDPGKTLEIRLQAVGETTEDGEVKVFFELNGQPRVIRVPNRAIMAKAAARPKAMDSNPGHIGAPMPGSVATVAVVQGQKVNAGDLLLTIEAMKMETGIHADRAAIVKALHVHAGSQIDAKDLLVELE